MRLPFTSRRPSPAMGVAFLALILAVSGTAVALPGKNTITSDDLKRGAVKNPDIGRGAVSSTKLRNGAVTTAKLRNEAVTGAKVNESSLGQVPSAATATNAGNATTVGGFAPGGLVRSAFAVDDDDALAGANGTALTTTITAPSAGFLMIDAGSDVFGSAADVVDCFIEVNETAALPSTRTVQLGAANLEEDCSTELTIQVAAGQHKVDLEGDGLAATTTFDETVLQVLFVPFGASGVQP